MISRLPVGRIEVLPTAPKTPCPMCRGAGKVTKGLFSKKSVNCEMCGGAGRLEATGDSAPGQRNPWALMTGYIDQLKKKENELEERERRLAEREARVAALEAASSASSTPNSIESGAVGPQIQSAIGKSAGEYPCPSCRTSVPATAIMCYACGARLR